MIFSRIALHGAALVLLLQASTTVSINSDHKISPLCVVSGRVATAGEGSPLKSARVVLIPERREQMREWQVYSALSGSDGRFTIKDVPPDGTLSLRDIRAMSINATSPMETRMA
jgi:hypothetical protein